MGGGDASWGVRNSITHRLASTAGAVKRALTRSIPRLLGYSVTHRHRAHVGLEHEVELPGRGEGTRRAGGRRGHEQQLLGGHSRQVLEGHGLERALRTHRIVIITATTIVAIATVTTITFVVVVVVIVALIIIIIIDDNSSRDYRTDTPSSPYRSHRSSDGNPSP